MVEALRIAAGDPAWTNGDLEDVSGRLESEVTPAKVDAAFCVPWIDPSDGTVFIGELNVMDEAQMNLFRLAVMRSSRKSGFLNGWRLLAHC